MDGLNCLGCDDVGFVDTIFQTAGGLLQGVAHTVQEQEAEDKKNSEQEQRLTAALAADTAATLAAATAAVSSQMRMKTASSDARDAAAKSAAQDAAGSGLDDARVQKRITAAGRELSNAKKNAAAKKDIYLSALARAWANTVDKLQGGSEKSGGTSQESWLNRRVIGPLSGTAVLAGAGILAVLGFVVLKRPTH